MSKRILFTALFVLQSSLVFAQHDLPATVTMNGKSTTITIQTDSGAVADPNQKIAGTDITPPVSQLSRDTAKALGMVNADGSLNADSFEKAPGGGVLTYTAEESSGTPFKVAVSKPVSIEVTDSLGNKKTVTLRVTVSPDPKQPGSDVFGNDALSAAAATEIHGIDPKTKAEVYSITWDNKPLEIPPGKKKSSLDRLPVPGGMMDASWDGVTFAAANSTPITGAAFLAFDSPYTFLSQSTAVALGLSSIGNTDLTGNLGLLDRLEQFGLYADSAQNFGVFGQAILPSLQVVTDDGSQVQYTDLPVLINPASTDSVLGADLLDSLNGTINGQPISIVTQIDAIGDTYIGAAPDPPTWQLILGGFVVGAGVMRMRSAAKRLGVATATFSRAKNTVVAAGST